MINTLSRMLHPDCFILPLRWLRWGLGHETMVCAVCLFIFLWESGGNEWNKHGPGNGLQCIVSPSLPLVYPRIQQSWKGLYWFHIVCPSICPICGWNGVCSVSSTILGRSVSYLHISYLHILMTKFKRCAECWVFKTSKIWIFWWMF